MLSARQVYEREKLSDYLTACEGDCLWLEEMLLFINNTRISTVQFLRA